ncbi:AAA domain protein [Vibrio phage 1.170.O._10N.261.52.C3]|nr:AAA domain protein [Vibrio phage 1.170.O._10N.261.52.C3]
MSKTLYLLRGISGSGKTTLAKTLQNTLGECYIVAADDFFYEDGEYRFKTHKLSEAHQWCQQQVHKYMNLFQVENIVVHNTFTTEKELKPYVDMAEKFGYRVVSLVVENRHGNESVHNVPEKTLLKQKQRLQGSIKL